jgi:hypothetical protein
VGIVFAFLGLYGMNTATEKKSVAYQIKITLGLVFAWPIMVGGAFLLALFFSNGLF